MVGSALVRALTAACPMDALIVRSRSELDLRSADHVRAFFDAERPDVVYLAAARVGGIQANVDAPAAFLYDNLMIQCNVIDSAAKTGVQRLCFLGSSCIYPRECPQPMREEFLMAGPLEPTNEGYALAKIAGVRLAQYHQRETGMRCLNPLPCNLYGPGDNFDPQHSHVLAALVRRFVEAADEGRKTVVLWGTGRARREFLHVDDLARAILLLMDRWDSPEIINVGCGIDVSIAELAHRIAGHVGYGGEIEFDATRPDGMPRKCLEVSKLTALGFRPEISLDEGIRQMIQQFRGLRQ